MSLKYFSKAELPFWQNGLGDDFALIENPGYIFPKHEVVPLAKKFRELDELDAVVMDMDGTTTTTEVLCIHSLEYMVRCITGRLTCDEWHGLDETNDYPHIIGNSTTKHVEYLVKTYKKEIKTEALKRFFIKAAVRTLCFGKDPSRIAEVKNNLLSFGVNKLQFASELDTVIETGIGNFEQCSAVHELIEKNFNDCKIDTENDAVRAAIDIYYARYHEILALISTGNGEKIVRELGLPPDRHLIEPMSGALLLLLLLKGKLHKSFGKFENFIKQHLQLLEKEIDDPETKMAALQHLSAKFDRKPVKIAVVTSSIKYEADIVLAQVFNIFRSVISGLKLPEEETAELTALFRNHNSFYDAVVTASDSSEIRLKPFRDLYSIALHKLAVPVERFNRVIGFEDSESGNVAIRAAGIGLAVAVPFAQTAGHNLNAAAYIAHDGLPEVIFKKQLFLKLH
ncbi:MAG: hypothetical protein LC102_11525 [Ignavibacteriales bacterium]|nr:MAG: HAD family phosphatase [Ignavibacteriaceae bacterium]MBW7872230.1 HAD family phosphatase [Ignavibacteria bacterium]MCZ2144043.1 hypothetical protein [Ignavibacteriales bacterium]MBV6445623.1 hypothetical protein [Ignavibacteriaceae bacterium]MBZ0195813.1 hypothetical protein [Ignavibacteriaceae bacterium]